jgi:hypothetical protein
MRAFGRGLRVLAISAVTVYLLAWSAEAFGPRSWVFALLANWLGLRLARLRRPPQPLSV